MKKLKFILPLLAMLFSFSCEKDNNIPLNQQQVDGLTSNPFMDNFGSSITARFIGTVVNEDNTPISGVTITIGSSMAITDANGVFSVEEAIVYEKFAYVKASKNGFIDGSRTLVPTDGVNQVAIMLLDIDPIATVASGQILNFDLPSGVSVELPGEYQTEFGYEYQGDVSVVIKHLNPDNDTMSLQMPGALIAENESGDLRVLETYGMIAVELVGENGEDLTMADETFATISIPVPTNATSLPATLPLWYFDEVYGYWKEEGFATLEGNKYVGEVSHFSFWNCDAPFAALEFCVTLQDSNGNPLPNNYVQLQRTATGWNSYSGGYTDQNGLICGLIPAEEALTLTITNYGCVGTNYIETIGSYSEDTNMTIIIPEATALTTNLLGVFNDCNGDAATNGYVQLFYNNVSSIIPITNGQLDLIIDYCATDTSFSAQFFDVTNGQSTDAVTGNFTTVTTDLGTQLSCTDLSDSDADGVLDLNEDLNGNNDLEDDDTDQDGIPDYLDTDDDGDGIETMDEDYDNDGNPMNEDSDGDQIPDYLDAQDVIVFNSEIYATNCDASNAQYDLTETYGVIYTNTDFSYFETQADAEASINAIINTSIYTNSSLLDELFVVTTNTTTNQSAIGQLDLLGLEFIDSDQDGIADCDEISGLDNGFGTCSPNGNITDPNNADSDGDGVNDCEEATAGTDPNDPLDF
ncbi:hypothetical protein [Olleya sp. HaHaR_3_96]|uniref:hypothetical protein n=1 Tax=Olleya sp. HaHaR_3_96 TaxID=2745560 RepID=UPI001C4EC99A|nr:hypothetical protein [Olleya sp. HaHaR_3_96]QXP59933.1 hypothetical protein H0I26_18820 [Olleya sp. HaHaR_3_96]